MGDHIIDIRSHRDVYAFYIILLYIIFTSYTDTNRIWVRPEKRRVGFRKCNFFNAKVGEHKIINHTVDGRNPAPVDK